MEESEPPIKLEPADADLDMSVWLENDYSSIKLEPVQSDSECAQLSWTAASLDESDSPSDVDYTVEYDCAVCGETYTSQDELRRHVASCSDSPNMDIHDPGEIKEEADDSESMDENGNSSTCVKCGNVYKNKAAMDRHFNARHTQKLRMFICPWRTCPYVSEVAFLVKRHVGLRHNNDMSPDEVTKYVKTPGHAHQRRKLVQNPKYIPDDASRLCGGKNKCNPHGRHRNNTCVDQFKCPVPGCERSSSSKRNIKSHLTTHSDLKPDVVWKFSQSIVRHCIDMKKEKVVKSVNSAEMTRSQKKVAKHAHKSVSCAVCNAVFSGLNRLSHLREHSKTYHEETVEYFFCPVEECTYKNMRKSKVKSHIFVKHSKHMTSKEFTRIQNPNLITKKAIKNPRLELPIPEEAN